ncbi:MAG: glycosyl hydrolase 115 family protein [Tannerellaceae bacterium]|nr:glycosyl hydrolase 115 family protein [Tannerellaceae bacterium]
MKRLTTFLILLLSTIRLSGTEQFVFTQGDKTWFPLAVNGKPVAILSGEGEDKGVVRAINDLKDDFRKVTGNTPAANSPYALIIGTKGKSALIDRLIREGKIEGSELEGKREKYRIQTVANAVEGITSALVVSGSDKRGTIYGIYELSRQIGVSPWYWWADVPVVPQENLYVRPGTYTDGEPAVRYRGIFINDEAPAFQSWCEEKFGGVNSGMYVHIFELILRLKGNFFWPAMWGNAFYDDDPLNGPLADEMGIVIGTSHHEPMGRAHEEWNRYGKGAWDYDKNPKVLQEFWRSGIERMKDFETVVTVGMRGDGDEPMSEGANIALLQRIISDQRTIIAKVTGKKAEERPQVWALYKEVQDYYDKGMRVPDDVTLLLCDDNWGNVRKLPDINAPRRKGGYGMYYHFDYVGGPRNYKWINVSQIQRTWEQMNLAYTHGVDRLWVVNVGDLKPMEFPISFFLDMAWNPSRFSPGNLLHYTEEWCAQQFGGKYAGEAARLINLYTKYNSRVTPELLDDKIYSLENYKEFETVVNDYKQLALDAFRLYNQLPAAWRDAFDELVLFPINGMCNLYEMYYALAMNKQYAKTYDMRANPYAGKVKECFLRDSLLTEHYNRDIAGGKWAHQMDQVRIGYTSWQQPARSIMPQVEYVYRKVPEEKRFIEKDGYISIEACHFARSQGAGSIRWEIIPDLGRTLSAVSTFPQQVYPKEDEAVYLEYDLLTVSPEGEVDVQLWLAPTLNFNANKGLRYALSIDGGKEEIVNFNGHYDGSLGKWQGERIIRTATPMRIGGAGNHTLRIRVLEPGIVFEKILLNFGGLKASYLGAPESFYVDTHSPFPAVPPAEGVTTRLDHDQMMEQLGLSYPALPPDEGAPNPSLYNTVRSAFGLWTNYVNEWEPNGDYYTGSRFYKPLKLHDLNGLSAQSWPERRAAIFEEVRKIYGAIPEEADGLKIEWTVSDPIEVKKVFSRNGLVETIPFRQYQITGKPDVSAFPMVRNAPVVSGTLRIPASVPEGTKTPVVINYAFSFGSGLLISDESLWNTMAPAGIGVLYFNAGALQPDNGEGLTSYLIGLVNQGAWRKPADWGTLVAWSWGISRFIDFFEQNNALADTRKIAVTGHSRYGKATLVAMAYDTRISTAFPSSSGAMGVAQSRRHWGEDLENCVWDSEYHWVAGNAMRYAGVDESSTDGYMPRKVLQMPVDAESLVALCAPRPLFIGSGDITQGDAWVDPYGLYLTAVAASPVYELLGKKGIVMGDTMDYQGKKIPMPVTDKAYLSGDIGFRRHHGGHEAGPNYPAFKEFILKYWK